MKLLLVLLFFVFVVCEPTSPIFAEWTATIDQATARNLTIYHQTQYCNEFTHQYRRNTHYGSISMGLVFNNLTSSEIFPKMGSSFCYETKLEALPHCVLAVPEEATYTGQTDVDGILCDSWELDHQIYKLRYFFATSPPHHPVLTDIWSRDLRGPVLIESQRWKTFKEGPPAPEVFVVHAPCRILPVVNQTNEYSLIKSKGLLHNPNEFGDSLLGRLDLFHEKTWDHIKTPVIDSLDSLIEVLLKFPSPSLFSNLLENQESDGIYKQEPIPFHIHPNNGIPAFFDSRFQWPRCAVDVRDQGACGSCWAHAAAEVFTDRMCIHTNYRDGGSQRSSPSLMSTISSGGKPSYPPNFSHHKRGSLRYDLMSVQDLVSCVKSNYGCGGGMMDNAWKYFAEVGVVKEMCYPYVSQNFEIPACKNSEAVCFYDDVAKWNKLKAVKYYAMPVSAEAIQKEIMTNGPVQGMMIIYEDFLHYHSGVYHHVTGKRLSTHSIKLIGWGSDEVSGDYWMIANSFGPEWGEHGFFRMRRGTNECGIEDDIVAGIVSLD